MLAAVRWWLAIVTTESRAQLVELRRDDGERWVGVAVSGDADAIRDALGKLDLPTGYRWVLVADRP
jgi:hypothetical protein